MLKSFSAKLLSALGMIAAFGVVCSISAALIAEEALTPDMRERVLCETGLSYDCVRADAARLAAENTSLQSRLAALEAQLDQVIADRDQLETVLSGGMHFSEGPEVAGLTVIVGTIYADPAGHGDVVRSICWAIQDRSGLDPRLTIAAMDQAGIVTALPVDAFDRSALNVIADDIDDARAVCPWPVASRS